MDFPLQASWFVQFVLRPVIHQGVPSASPGRKQAIGAAFEDHDWGLGS